LLRDLGLEYSYVDVDLLLDPDKTEAYDEIKQHNDNVSFPTVIIDNGEEIIVGFEEEKLRSLK
jgi:glutaredoxin-like protein NrdH